MTAIPMPPSRIDPTSRDAVARLPERPGRCEASVAEFVEAKHGQTTARLIWAFLKAMAR